MELVQLLRSQRGEAVEVVVLGAEGSMCGGGGRRDKYRRRYEEWQSERTLKKGFIDLMLKFVE